MKNILLLCIALLTSSCGFLNDDIKRPVAEKITVKVSTDISDCQLDSLFEAIDYFNDIWNIEGTAFKVVMTTPESIVNHKLEQWRIVYVDFAKHEWENEEMEYYCVNPMLDEETSCYVGLGGNSLYNDNAGHWNGTIVLQEDYCPANNDYASLNLWLHEFGHVFGLSHVEHEDDPDNIMNPNLQFQEASFTDEQIEAMKSFALTEEDLQNVN